MHYCYALLLALVHAVLCDYRLEVELVRYTGTGLLGDGSCCDLELNENRCSTAETCDVDFLFRIQNIGNEEVNLNAQTKGAGLYIDSNLINFVNCQQFPTTTSVVASNPLTFDIPSSSWSDTNTLRMTVSARDFDAAAGAGSDTFGDIGSPFFDLARPATPSETFSDTVSATQGAATITYRYRVICTDNSCGDDCSQTANCPQWSLACDGIGTFGTPTPTTDSMSLPNPCLQSPSPCRNGGSCLAISSMQYECECTSGFGGDDCEIDTSAPLMTTMMQTTIASTTTSMTSTDGIQGSTDVYGNNGSSRRVANHWLIVCAVTFLIRNLM